MADQDRKGQAKDDDADRDEADRKDADREDAEDADREDAESAKDEADDEDRKSPAPKAKAKDAPRAKPAAKAKKAKDEAEEEADDEAEDEASDDEPEDDAKDEENSDAAAKRVAEALGVEGGEAEGEAKDEATDEAPAAPPNRAARRQEAALRRKGKKNKPAEAKDAVDEDLPKDRNARARELLKRRREQAAEGPKQIDLLPGEMVDDALARSASAVGKWIRTNFNIIQWVVIAGLVVGGGYLIYNSQVEKKSAAASDALFEGVLADRGAVRAEDKRSDEEKAVDPTKVFKTTEARADAALAGYRKVITEHPNTGAAILARLGEGNAHLDKREWDKALAAYSAVVSSTLAGADQDVKGRALEGLGMAKEGKGDLDGALASFKELETLDARGYKELGMYQQARIHLTKGDKEKAKDLLKTVHDKLAQPTLDGKQFHYLEQVVDETLRKIDPSLVPSKAPVIGGPKGNTVSPDELEKIRRMIQEKAKQKPQHEEH